MKKVLISVLTVVILLVVAGLLFILYSTRVKLSDTIPDIDSRREAKVLTAFFGLDNELPLFASLLYYRALGKDGMPLVFSEEIDPRTLDNTDFEVITKNGDSFDVEFVTLRPANEEFELRTVLFIGEYGNHPENPPVRVNITGDLKSRSGQSYKGQSVAVIPLPDGPILSYAEYFTFDEDYPYVEKGRGCDCLKDETAMVVRTVWSGGVRAVTGEDLGDNEINDFQVTMVHDGDTLIVTPYKLADLSDNDNNIDLCLKETGVPIWVKVNENIAIDPRDDKNPKTEIGVRSRW